MLGQTLQVLIRLRIHTVCIINIDILGVFIEKPCCKQSDCNVVYIPVII